MAKEYQEDNQLIVVDMKNWPLRQHVCVRICQCVIETIFLLIVFKNLSVCCNIVSFSAFCGTTCSWGTALSARAKRVKCSLAIIHHIIGNNNAWISGHFCVLVFFYTFMDSLHEPVLTCSMVLRCSSFSFFVCFRFRFVFSFSVAMCGGLTGFMSAFECTLK